jgi:glucose uptake protein GlcU
LSIVGVVALIMLVVGAFMYLTAAGEEDRIDTGKSIVKYSIIGIAIALAALVLVRQVASFF